MVYDYNFYPEQKMLQKRIGRPVAGVAVRPFGVPHPYPPYNVEVLYLRTTVLDIFTATQILRLEFNFSSLLCLALRSLLPVISHANSLIRSLLELTKYTV